MTKNYALIVTAALLITALGTSTVFAQSRYAPRPSFGPRPQSSSDYNRHTFSPPSTHRPPFTGHGGYRPSGYHGGHRPGGYHPSGKIQYRYQPNLSTGENIGLAFLTGVANGMNDAARHQRHQQYHNNRLHY